MESNKQNTVLLTIIAVATLLVAVVGATFAYFTSTKATTSISEVVITGGKMSISYAADANGEQSGTVILTKTDFKPSPDVLVHKTFSLTGTNTATGNGTTALNMPYAVSIEYKSGFQNTELHYTISRTGTKDKKVTSSIDSAAKTGTFKKTVPGTGENPADRVIATDGTTTETEPLVTGVFQAETGATHTINFTFEMTFPDTNKNQDYNKGAEFLGKIVFTSDKATAA